MGDQLVLPATPKRINNNYKSIFIHALQLYDPPSPSLLANFNRDSLCRMKCNISRLASRVAINKLQLNDKRCTNLRPPLSLSVSQPAG